MKQRIQNSKQFGRFSYEADDDQTMSENPVRHSNSEMGSSLMKNDLPDCAEWCPDSPEFRRNDSGGARSKLSSGVWFVDILNIFKYDDRWIPDAVMMVFFLSTVLL